MNPMVRQRVLRCSVASLNLWRGCGGGGGGSGGATATFLEGGAASAMAADGADSLSSASMFCSSCFRFRMRSRREDGLLLTSFHVSVMTRTVGANKKQIDISRIIQKISRIFQNQNQNFFVNSLLKMILKLIYR